MNTIAELVEKYSTILDVYAEKKVDKSAILLGLTTDVRSITANAIMDVINGIPEPIACVYQDEYDNECAVGGIVSDRENINRYIDSVKNILTVQA